KLRQLVLFVRIRFYAEGRFRTGARELSTPAILRHRRWTDTSGSRAEHRAAARKELSVRLLRQVRRRWFGSDARRRCGADRHGLCYAGAVETRGALPQTEQRLSRRRFYLEPTIGGVAAGGA